MASATSTSEPLSPLERAVLATVLYGDLFDHPLTVDEIHRYLVGVACPDRRELERAVEALDGRYLGSGEGFVFWRGREAMIEVRRRRTRLAAERWPPARRFARWLGWVPFLRMVAVCGSQAVDNGDDDGDVDLFLITEPGRLWLVQSMTMVLRRFGRLLGIDVCPNYLLTTGALEIEERSLYAAREAAQAVPLWGLSAYARFREANRWIDGFLPQLAIGQRPVPEPRPRHLLTALLERLLGGRAGDLADRAVHRVLLAYYRWRLRRHGWHRRQIERAYRRDRQVVITGGYAAAVARRFVDRGTALLGGLLSADELRAVFFGPAGDPAAASRADRVAPDPLYAGLMAARYGSGP
jgi:hypothetical protein